MNLIKVCPPTLIVLLLFLTWFNAIPTNVLATTEPFPYPETQTNQSKADTKIFGIIRRATDWVFGGGNDNPGAPSDRRRGGATRDQCPPSPIRLTALVPSSDADLSRQATKTIAEHPVFWFYVPFSNQLDRQMEFVLIDDQEEDFYSQTFSLPETSGIVKIQIPTAQPGLEVDKRYHWVFSIICNSGNRSGDIAVDGWARRVEMESDLARDLQKVGDDLRQQVRLYAEARLWHEMLSTMIALREANLGNQEIQTEWVELLDNVGLSELVSQPVTTCCQVEN